MTVRNPSSAESAGITAHHCGEPNPDNLSEKCRRMRGHKAKNHAGLWTTWPVVVPPGGTSGE